MFGTWDALEHLWALFFTETNFNFVLIQSTSAKLIRDGIGYGYNNLNLVACNLRPTVYNTVHFNHT